MKATISYAYSVRDVSHYAEQLAEFLNQAIFPNFPQAFLKSFFTPYVAAWLVYSEDIYTAFAEAPPASMRELYSVCKGISDTRLREPDPSVICPKNTKKPLLYMYTAPNFYERLLFKFNGVSVASVALRVSEEPRQHKRADTHLRASLIEKSYDERFRNCTSLIKYMPVSILETLKKGYYGHTIGGLPPGFESLNPCVNLEEHYAFHVAKAKASGRLVFGQPHGGYYCQGRCADSYELCEKALSDFFQGPSWEGGIVKFPNFRVSKNLFLSKINFVKNVLFKNQKNDHVFLIVLPYYWGKLNDQSVLRKILSSIGSLVDSSDNESVIQVLFKLHPFESKADIDLFEEAMRQELPWLEVRIAVAASCRELFVAYKKILIMSPFATAIFELAPLKRVFHLYADNEELRSSYENFLRCEALEVVGVHRGRLFKLSSAKFKTAYNAMYFYPYYFSKHAVVDVPRD
jgi:hypothetical protein